MGTTADTVTVLRARSGVLAKRIHWQPNGTLQVQGFSAGLYFSVREKEVSSFAKLAKLLDRLSGDPHACIIRGEPLPGINRSRTRRLLHPDPDTGEQPTFAPASSQWLLIDIDGVPEPPGLDFRTEPEQAALHVRDLLPEPFRDAACWWQATASAGIKPGIRLRLAFWLSRPISDTEAKVLLAGSPVDLALYNPVQPHYIAAPILGEGVRDPMLRRSGRLTGFYDTVQLPERIDVPAPKARSRKALSQTTRVEIAAARPEPEFLAALRSADRELDELCRVPRVRKEDGSPDRSQCDWDVALHLHRGGHGADEISAALLSLPLGQIAAEPRPSEQQRKLGLIFSKLAAPAELPVPPPQVAPPRGADTGPLPAAQAVARLRDEIERFVATATAPPDPKGKKGEGPPQQLGIAATVGLGKSATTLEIIAARAQGETVWWFVPTVALAEELSGKARALGLATTVIRGREQIGPEGEPMCAKAELAASVARAGQGVQESLCRRETRKGKNKPGKVVEQCPFYDDCAYQAQFEGLEERLVILAHEYLRLPKKRLPQPKLVVIDESFHKSLISNRSSMPIDRIGEYRAAPLAVAQAARRLPRRRRGDPHASRARMGEAADEGAAEHLVTAGLVRKALETGQHPRKLGLTRVQLETAARVEWAFAAKLAISPGMDERRQRERIERLLASERLRFGSLYRLLGEDFDRAEPSQRVVYRRDVPWKGELQNRIFLYHRRKLELPAAVPVLVLDADLDPLIVRKVLPRLEVVRIEAELQALVIQVHDQTGARSWLELDQAKRELQALAAVEAARGGKVLVVTHKEVAKLIEPPEAGSKAHLGGIRGLDRFKDHDTIIVAGRLEPAPRTIEGSARAWFGDDAEPLRLLPEPEEGKRLRYPRSAGVYRMADGSARAASVNTHPDPRVQAMLEQVREREIEQAVGRLRMVHRERPARVILATSVPTRLRAARLAGWHELVPDRMTQSVVLLDGVLPLSASELARALPLNTGEGRGLWASAEAVRKEWSRKGVTSLYKASHKGLSHLSAFWSVCTLPTATHVSYRRPGQRRGSPHQAIVPGECDAAAASIALDRTLGDVEAVRVIGILRNPDAPSQPAAPVIHDPGPAPLLVLLKLRSGFDARCPPPACSIVIGSKLFVLPDEEPAAAPERDTENPAARAGEAGYDPPGSPL